MTGRLTGKVIVVTGAAGGQGAEEVRMLAGEGATVVATDMSAPIGPVEELPAVHRRALDVTDPGAWSSLADDLRREHGHLHGLVNNAGATHRARLLEVDLADWDRIFKVNATGPLLGIQALVPLMPPGSSIVTVGSAAALTPHYTVAYTVSKWAARALARVASLELGPLGIRSNLIHPGYIETPMTASAPATFRAAQIEANPLGVLGTPEDVAHLVVYLLSDESRYVSGAEIAVDGGYTGQAGVKPLSDAVLAATPSAQEQR